MSELENFIKGKINSSVRDRCSILNYKFVFEGRKISSCYCEIQATIYDPNIAHGNAVIFIPLTKELYLLFKNND